MIEVSYLEIESKITTLEIKGHANYARKGEDIVCSAVSAISVGGINALQNINLKDITCESGYIFISGESLKTEYNQIVLTTMITQLYTIEKSYGKFIKISKS